VWSGGPWRPVDMNKINKVGMALNDIMDLLYVLKADEVDEEDEDEVILDDDEEDEDTDDEEGE